MSRYLRECLNKLTPYKVEHIPYKIKLDANESPFDLPNEVKTSLASELLSGLGFNRYPDSDAIALRDLLADKLRIHRDQLMVGSGSDELLQIIVNAYIEKGDIALCPTPSFGMYSVFTQIAGGKPVNVPMDDDFNYDMDRLYHDIDKYCPKIVFLCSPNNPTGNVIDVKYVIDLLEKTRSIFVLDEAYIEFFGESYAERVLKYPNAIILRTFSKAFGLAGLRVGYLQADNDLLDDLYKVKPPYNISSFSQRAACIMLENEGIVQKRISEIIKLRDVLVRRLTYIDSVTVYPSYANFILIKVANAGNVYASLLNKGILVRNFKNNTALNDCLRITVGDSRENDILANSLQQIISGG